VLGAPLTGVRLRKAFQRLDCLSTLAVLSLLTSKLSHTPQGFSGDRVGVFSLELVTTLVTSYRVTVIGRYGVKFSEFIKMLKPRFPKMSQERFASHIFAALCGDPDPVANNKEDSSVYLPEGLRGIDESYRKKLYIEKFGGLSQPIKTHIKEKQNPNTFIAYCEKAITSTEYPKLAAAFGLSETTNRTAVYYGLFKQFIEFALNPTDEAEDVVVNGVADYRKYESSSSLSLPTPLYPNDDFAVSGNQNPKVSYEFYKDFKFNWSITNSGKVAWIGRTFRPSQLHTLKTNTPEIKIPTLRSGEKTNLCVELNTRGDERGSPYVVQWEICDENGRNCFPNKEPICLTVEVRNPRNTKTEETQ
jgi:hypothetical protein